MRAFYREVKNRGLPIRAIINHYNSLAFYVPDPEGTLIESAEIIGESAEIIGAELNSAVEDLKIVLNENGVHWDTGRRDLVP
ncbi:MAG: hypothetical protein HY691_10900 [Chloroflexi bacterium]|nr:hypothetical protein [Chloroflexota bacterium]